jgi:hypothetical protein
MREVKDPEEAKRWLGNRNRNAVTDLVTPVENGRLVKKTLSREMDQVAVDVR